MSRDYLDQGIPVAADSGSKKTSLLVMCSCLRLLMVLASEFEESPGQDQGQFFSKGKTQ
jgi:hypothetical protein